jgi:hypothetical protein
MWQVKNIKGLIMNMETMREFFDGMDLSDVESLFKEYKKQRKASEKADKIHKAKKSIEVGDIVSATFKGEIITGYVVAMREKTLSIITEDVLNKKGEPARISRGYDLITEVVKEEEITEEAAV